MAVMLEYDAQVADSRVRAESVNSKDSLTRNGMVWYLVVMLIGSRWLMYDTIP